jgi:hypothetical protein
VATGGVDGARKGHDNARAEGAQRPRHCPSSTMTMDVHPSRTAVTCLHRVAAAKTEPFRGDRARLAGIHLD